MIISDKQYDMEGYIGDYYYKSPYLYLNLLKYGATGGPVATYRQIINNNTTCVLLKYHKTLHILSKNDASVNVREVLSLLNSLGCNMLCGSGEIIDRLYSIADKGEFAIEMGNTRELSSIEPEPNREDIRAVRGDDLLAVAHIVCKDKFFSSACTEDELYRQIRSRNDEGYSRNYVLEADGKIVAHAGTGAENDEMAIITHVIVDPDYRRRGYAFRILRALCSDLIAEGKKCYLINYTEASTNLYDKLGFKLKCRYGRCYRK